MFERTKVDNCHDQAAVTASVELDDGRRVSGRFLIARSKTLAEVLNSAAGFIEFEPFDGDKLLLAKSAIRSLRLISAPAGPDPVALIRDRDAFDPHQILGLAKGASRSDVRAAFFAQAKAYHPDRYANADLPPEVTRYLAAMARRINAAYEALSEETARRDAMATKRAEPVYHSSAPAF